MTAIGMGTMPTDNVRKDTKTIVPDEETPDQKKHGNNIEKEEEDNGHQDDSVSLGVSKVHCNGNMLEAVSEMGKVDGKFVQKPDHKGR